MSKDNIKANYVSNTRGPNLLDPRSALKRSSLNGKNATAHESSNTNLGKRRPGVGSSKGFIFNGKP